MLGLVLLIGGRLWQPQVAVAQAKQPAVPDVVQARAFGVVDAMGKPPAILTTTKDGTPGLDLFDAAGRASVSLGLTKGGRPSLHFFDAEGKGGANWRLTKDGRSNLELLDPAGKLRAALGLREDGSPYLGLLDKNQKFRAVMGATSPEPERTVDFTMRPESSLVLFDTDGKVVWQAP
jgi:hypothetical protein